MFLECYVPCLIVSNREQLFNFLNQSISVTCTAFKRPTKKLGMCGLFILGLGYKGQMTIVVNFKCLSDASKSFVPSFDWYYLPTISFMLPLLFH